MAQLVSMAFLGFFLGMRHATDPDHVIAVTTIVSRERWVGRAARIGLFWGLGHTVTIFVVGGAILLFDVVIPAATAAEPARPWTTPTARGRRASHSAMPPNQLSRRAAIVALSSSPRPSAPCRCAWPCTHSTRVWRWTSARADDHSRRDVGCCLSGHLRHGDDRRNDAHHGGDQSAVRLHVPPPVRVQSLVGSRDRPSEPRLRPFFDLPDRHGRWIVHARPSVDSTLRALTVHSLIHSGLFQAASALRNTLNLKGRNFRFE